MHSEQVCHWEPVRRPRARSAIALLIIATAATLTACETIESIERHGLAASAFHAAYCEADAGRRDELDLMLVFEDGSPKLDVHCDPHRGEEEDFHPPRLQ